MPLNFEAPCSAKRSLLSADPIPPGVRGVWSKSELVIVRSLGRAQHRTLRLRRSPSLDQEILNVSFPRFLRPATALLSGIALLSAACTSSTEGAAPAPFVIRTDSTVRAANPLSRQVPVNDSTPVLSLELQGLPGLGQKANYEVWHIVDGQPLSGGIFDLTSEGDIWNDDRASGEAVLWGHVASEAIVITIEPQPDPDPGPADTHVLAGLVSENGRVVLTADHPAALATDFMRSTGSFVLATPTDGPETNERSGIWFVDPVQGEASLDLPELPAGWIYEGWAVVNGLPISTGTFTDPGAADSAAPFSGDAPGPPFPGEDFLRDGPPGVPFPTDLAGQQVVISVEPVPDNSPEPFPIHPLWAQIPNDVEPEMSITMMVDEQFVVGLAHIGPPS